MKSFLKFDQSEQWVCLKYYKEVLTLESIDAVPHCCHANLILHNSCCFLFNFQTWPPCLTVLISIRAGCLTVFFLKKKKGSRCVFFPRFLFTISGCDAVKHLFEDHSFVFFQVLCKSVLADKHVKLSYTCRAKTWLIVYKTRLVCLRCAYLAPLLLARKITFVFCKSILLLSVTCFSHHCFSWEKHDTCELLCSREHYS